MSRLLLLTALAFAFAGGLALSACHGSPEPAADVPMHVPEDHPSPTPPAAPPAQPPAPARVATVPARFRGQWDGTRDGCRVPGELHLVLAADRVVFHEGGGPVLQARQRGDDLELAVQLSGEGETRDARYAFRLADGGQRLIDLGAGGAVRIRCP
jgi:hypothetical protein